MKISNSKKQLAKIIHENGGWRDGAESAAQCSNGEISFWHDTATKEPEENWCGDYLGKKYDIEFTGYKLPNWHQTLLSRDEYFHLYPAPDADGWIEWCGGECPVDGSEIIDIRYPDSREEFGAKAKFRRWNHCGDNGDIIAYRLHKPEVKPEFCESVMRSIPEPSDNPTIEQLATDYRNRKDYADRKQQEADAAKAGAEAKLAELVAAGEALGLVLGVVGSESETELVITDWRDLQVGDVIWYGGDDELSPGEYYVTEIEAPNYVGYRTVQVNSGNGGHWIDTRMGWRFIRRPT